jgi:hypothetical protein
MIGENRSGPPPAAARIGPAAGDFRIARHRREVPLRAGTRALRPVFDRGAASAVQLC